MKLILRLIPAASLILVACGGDGGDVEPRVTYWQDVAPIYVDNCVSCHREGGAAPFRLDNYEDAQGWAQASAAAVSARTMPPWLVRSDGECGTFLNSRALSDDEIDRIAAWADDGMPEGELRDDLEAPPATSLTDAQTLSLPEFYPEIVGGPLAEFDEYRCFMVDPALTRDTFINGYEVVPGNDAIVHHVLAFTVDPDERSDGAGTNREAMAELDAQSSDRDGWPCFEGAGETVAEKAIPVAWAPGQGAVEYPHGTGLPIGAGEVVVVQVHYNLSNSATHGQSDQTALKLRFADEVDQPADMALPDLFLETIEGPEPASLAPGQAAVEYAWEIPIASALEEYGADELKLFGVLPHMHELGQRITLTIDRGGDQVCAADVPAWDFDWQLMYFYEQPIALGSGDTLRVTCEYDTRGKTEPVTPGWGTQNEMCLMGLFLGAA